MSDLNSFRRDASGLMWTLGLTIPASAISNIVLAQGLSVDSRGVYALALSLSTTLALICQLGWPSANIYALRRLQADPGRVMSTSLIAGSALALVGVTACLLNETLVRERFLAGASESVFLLSVVAIPIFLLAAILQSAARGIDRFSDQNRYDLSVSIGTLLCVSLVLGVRGGSVAEVLAAVLGSQLLMLGLFARRVIGQTGLRAKGNKELWQKMQAFGLKSYAMSVVGRLHVQLDIFLIAILLGDPAAAAMYAVAAGIVNLTNIVPEAICVAAYPRLAELEPDEAAEFTCQLCRQSFLFVLLTMVGGALVLPILIPLFYGEDYAGAVRTALILLPAMASYSLFRVLGRFYTASNRQAVTFRIQFAATFVNLCLNWVLIPRLGFEGAAVASLVSYGVASSAAVFAFRRETGRPLKAIMLPGLKDVQALLALARGAIARSPS